ncbi:MAG: hypothetical protein IT341_06860 [Chloroflexi bacterium]|nr:hypothetical protein [Chloroflexota bacterium]
MNNEDAIMRSIGWVVAIVIAAVFISTRVSAQQPGDTQSKIYLPSLSRGAIAYRDVPTAMITRTPTATPPPTATGTSDVVGTIVAATLTAGAPTPTDTPDRIQTSVAATLIALTSTATHTATTTRTPTATHMATATSTSTPAVTPTPICAEQIRNGGFEDGLAFWDVSGQGIADTTGRSGDTPFEGSRFLEMWPPDDDSYSRVQSNRIVPPPPGRLVSATVRYQLRGRSVGELERTDALIVNVQDPDVLRCSDCRHNLELLWNKEGPRDWRARAFDVTAQFRAGWQEIVLYFSAQNDFFQSTWWHIDAASLVVCTK